MNSGRWIGLPVRWAALLTIVGYVAGLFAPMLFMASAVAAVQLGLLVAALAAAGAAGRSTMLAGRAMRFLGDTPFAFYLVHDLVLIMLLVGLGADVGQACGRAPCWCWPASLSA
ncbi:hypothetical protein Vqi01_43700 [Micromonospora qiuiae]|uniref:Acyltransferase 3 domain-containing protein n=2 Tax=Micromonospora qiuiae TaxID=502268 RepID=A0ABQ4JFT0_9ACTN|nr:hypothetical protein Vqi01_43700 [Micromonospora qiuiae]